MALIGAVAGLAARWRDRSRRFFSSTPNRFDRCAGHRPGSRVFVSWRIVANDTLAYAFAFITLSAYAIALIVATYWIARRAALGLEGTAKTESRSRYLSGRLLRLATAIRLSELSAVVEKELRYAMRNAQVRMMALMPLILIFIRLVNSQRMEAARDVARSPDVF